MVFLQEEALLPTYLELYDIVLTGDSNMDVVNAVVAAMLNIRHDDTSLVSHSENK